MANNMMTAWNPVQELQRGIDRLFDDFMAPAGRGGPEGFRGFVPACDIEETDTHYVLTFDVPGMKKEDIKIECQGDQLVVSGTRKSETERKEGASHRVERSYGEFRRAFTLPATIDAEHAEAAYENGVLTLAVPKTEAARPRQIKIGDAKAGVLGKLLSLSGGRRDAKRDVEVTTRKAA